MTSAATGSIALGLQLAGVLAIPDAPAFIHCSDHEDYFMVFQVSYDLSNAALQNLSERKSLSYEKAPWCLFDERDVNTCCEWVSVIVNLRSVLRSNAA